MMKLSLSVIFLYAGYVKILDPKQFFIDISNYQILPDYIVYISSYFLPPFEIIIAVCLFIKSKSKVALFLISSLLIIFLIAIISAWIRGLDISCGCFGKGSSSLTMTFIRNCVLLTFAGIICLYNKNKKLT